jgi:hypothetical protein
VGNSHNQINTLVGHSAYQLKGRAHMSKEADVIAFPESRIVREPPNKFLQEQIARSTKRQVDILFNELRENIIDFLDRAAVDMENADFFRSKDWQFAMDSMKSCLYRNYKIKHNLHKFVDKNVVIEDNGLPCDVEAK